jgi:CPA1 family monovalent cation:H+ antiporter
VCLGVSFELPLTSEVTLAVLLPTIVFQGTLTLDVRRLGRNAPLVVALAVVGLPVSVVLLGWVGTRAFGFPLLVSLLFAAIILPTDPAAVLSLFEQFDVAERLAVTIEGESLLNDGVAIVIFTTLLGAFDSATVSVDRTFVALVVVVRTLSPVPIRPSCEVFDSGSFRKK